MRIRFEQIKELVQVRNEPIQYVGGTDMNILPTIKDAYLTIENDRIASFGAMSELQDDQVDQVVQVDGKMILPTWCDAHTHLVYVGNREHEFVQRLQGVSYEEIAKQGGGILNSAKQLEEASEDEIYRQSEQRLREVIRQGTGAIEIKSGYGLVHDAELKMLRVIQRLAQSYNLPIQSTYLAAHALPAAYKDNQSGYVQEIVEQMIPEVARARLAQYIDVFCEQGFFSVNDMTAILKAGTAHGLQGKVHVNQFNVIGGVPAAVASGARSVDHLEELSNNDIHALKSSSTMPVALPGCSLFLGIPYTPGRKIIDAGLPLALSSDYNPGSSPSGNMNLVVALSCMKMRLTPAEAINAATINSAYAMGLEDEVGSISVGKKANFIVTKPINSISELPYRFGDVLIDSVYISGKAVA